MQFLFQKQILNLMFAYTSTKLGFVNMKCSAVSIINIGTEVLHVCSPSCIALLKLMFSWFGKDFIHLIIVCQKMFTYEHWRNRCIVVSGSDLQKVHFSVGEILHFIRNVLVGISLCKYLKWNVLKLVELVQEKDIECIVFQSILSILCIWFFWQASRSLAHFSWLFWGTVAMFLRRRE